MRLVHSLSIADMFMSNQCSNILHPMELTMQTKLSDRMPNISNAVAKLNEDICGIWDNAYPKAAIDAYNEYRSAKARAKGKTWVPVRHFAPVQYPDLVFPPTYGNERLDTEPAVVAHDAVSTLESERLQLLLFIGLNPSSPDTNVLADLHDYGARNEKYSEIVSHEAKVWSNYDTYFGPIRSFRTPLYKYHVDVFAIRHTNAKVIEDFMNGAWTANPQERSTVQDFFIQQFNALHTFLQSVCPSQAIVINALAGRIFTGALNHGIPYNENSDMWTSEPARIQLGNWPTYMHSSGMMSSGNMDNGSKTRLEAVSYAIHKRGTLL